MKGMADGSRDEQGGAGRERADAGRALDDERWMRDALAAHPWPAPSAGLMARLHRVGVVGIREDGGEVGTESSRDVHDAQRDRRRVGGRRRVVELVGAAAVVVGVIAVMAGGGDGSVLRRAERADGPRFEAAEEVAVGDAGGPAIALGQAPSMRPSPWPRADAVYPAYPGYEANDALALDVTHTITRPTLAMALAGRAYALLSPPNDELAVVSDNGFRVLDGSGSLPMRLSPTDDPARTIAHLDSIGGTIAVEGNLAFVAGTSFYSGDQLWVVDMSEPRSPTIVASVPTPIGAWFRGSILARNGLVYVMRNDQTLAIYDVTDARAPRELSSRFVPDRAQIHLVDDAVLVSGHAIDISDAANPRSIAGSAPGWPNDDPFEWAVVDSRAYVPFQSSLLVLDVSDPFAIRSIGRVEMVDRVFGAYQAGGLIVVRYPRPCCDSDAVEPEPSILKPLVNGAAPDPRASAPLPPPGTRLYASVAELLADPPAAGPVWVDAYIGEVIEASLVSSSPCPGAAEWPVLLDEPRLMQLSAFGEVVELERASYFEPVRVSPGVDEQGQVTPIPKLPRFGRLVLRRVSSNLAMCPARFDVEVERVAHVFEPTTDWARVRNGIRNAGTRGSFADSNSNLEGGKPDSEILDRYSLEYPTGLERSEAPSGVAFSFIQPNLPDHPVHFRRSRVSEADSVEWSTDIPLFTTRYLQPMLDDYPAVVLPFAPRQTFTVTLGYLDDEVRVRAESVFEGIEYVFELTLPPDGYSAQRLLWRFQELIDRFTVYSERVPQPAANAGSTPTEPRVVSRPCPTRAVPEPLPTSTAYDADDVMNDLRTTGFGLAELTRDPTLIVSATLGAVVQRTTTRYAQSTVDATTRFAFPPMPDRHTLWQPITVLEVFKGAERVAPGEGLAQTL